jgi:hypothetical protein
MRFFDSYFILRSKRLIVLGRSEEGVEHGIVPNEPQVFEVPLRSGDLAFGQLVNQPVQPILDRHNLSFLRGNVKTS